MAKTKKTKPEPAATPAPKRNDQPAVAQVAQTPPVAEPQGRFFRVSDWAAFHVTTLASLAVYCYTLAPTVTLEDSGELAVAGDYFGVPHPPGYPIWTFIVGIFAKVFSFVRYLGQPNPSWSIGLASAVFGALAAGTSALLISRSGFDLLRHIKESAGWLLADSTANLICFCGGVSASLLFAFSPAMWSQSVIVEVYSLNALFLSLLLALVYRWMCRPSDKFLFITAYVFGLGLTNYQVLLFMILMLSLLIMLRDMELFTTFVVVGFFYALTYILIKRKALPPIQHPLHITCYVYVCLNFLLLLATYYFLPRGRTVALTILFAQLGVAFYAFMPIASEFNPPMNWAYPRTWEGFQHAISRGQYEQISPTDLFSPAILMQVGDYLADLRGQFTLPVAVLGFLPFTMWGIRLPPMRFSGLLVALILTLGAAGLVVIEEIATHTTILAPGVFAMLDNSYRFLIGAVMILLVMGCIVMVTSQFIEMGAALLPRNKASLWQRAGVVIVILMSVAVVLGVIVLIVKKMMPVPNAKPTLSVEGGLTLLALMILMGVVAAMAAWLSHKRNRLEAEMDSLSQKWILGTIAGFIVMGLVVVVLANPKGDIQDAFIQRVKFISSHAMYAIWIGYGIIAGWAMFDHLVRGSRLIRAVGVCVSLALPIVPILENGFNRDLIRVYGGAEQNAHDFGWQFGNYQLRGAEAIIEELSGDEEPIPNPAFPPDMGTNAVFYGGTDPGRFVPTYMIFSARVREDIFLITQNALADNTYMSVMRDLYGDDIWIPSTQDTNEAFREYYTKHGQADISNGRIQVRGVEQVMMINGILAKMIFEHNRWRHDFYVEESYVINWMYPYLSPHGLIMKINRDTLPGLPVEVVRDDFDFWDWYCRRLTGDPKFVRDVVARKSFSKLRSSIGGLYAFRGMLPHAERAFREAILLYPLSPEANFRLADMFMRAGRFDDATALMKDYSRQDPDNTKVEQFLQQVDNAKKMETARLQLEARTKEGQLDLASAFQLADIYRKMQREEPFVRLLTSIIENDSLPPQAYIDASRMCLETKRFDLMETAMQRYAGRVPTDMRAWLDLGAVRCVLQKHDAAVTAIQHAVKVGGDEARNLIRSDRRFAPLFGREDFRSLVVPPKQANPLPTR